MQAIQRVHDITANLCKNTTRTNISTMMNNGTFDIAGFNSPRGRSFAANSVNGFSDIDCLSTTTKACSTITLAEMCSKYIYGQVLNATVQTACLGSLMSNVTNITAKAVVPQSLPLLTIDNDVYCCHEIGTSEYGHALSNRFSNIFFSYQKATNGSYSYKYANYPWDNNHFNIPDGCSCTDGNIRFNHLSGAANTTIHVCFTADSA